MALDNPDRDIQQIIEDVSPFLAGIAIPTLSYFSVNTNLNLGIQDTFNQFVYGIDSAPEQALQEIDITIDEPITDVKENEHIPVVDPHPLRIKTVEEPQVEQLDSEGLPVLTDYDQNFVDFVNVGLFVLLCSILVLASGIEPEEQNDTHWEQTQEVTEGEGSSGQPDTQVKQEEEVDVAAKIEEDAVLFKYQQELAEEAHAAEQAIEKAKEAIISAQVIEEANPSAEVSDTVAADTAPGAQQQVLHQNISQMKAEVFLDASIDSIITEKVAVEVDRRLSAELENQANKWQESSERKARVVQQANQEKEDSDKKVKQQHTYHQVRDFPDFKVSPIQSHRTFTEKLQKW